MPLEAIGNGLGKDLRTLDSTLETARGTLTTANGTLLSATSTINNADNFVEPNSMQSQELDNMLLEITRAARSIRVLADFLERHPEALIRGKKGEPQ
jgi:paraquat-inducible protein B